MAIHLENRIHPAIQERINDFKNVHYNFEIGPDSVDIDVIMKENVEYLLENGCNCQVFSNVLEGSVLNLIIPPYYKSQEKFEDNTVYRPVEDDEELLPGDLFLFGTPNHQMDIRFLHQATFTGMYSLENEPLLAHFPGHYKKRIVDGKPKQKIPGPRVWSPSEFARQFRENAGTLWVVKRPERRLLLENGASELDI